MTMFHRIHSDDSELEGQASELFSDLAELHLSHESAVSIRSRILEALSLSTSRPTNARFAFASPAVLGPLMAVSAVAAATGENLVSAPLSLVESAASTLTSGNAEAAPATGADSD